MTSFVLLVANALAVDVLIVHSAAGYISDVQTNLINSRQFQTVDVWDGSMSTPTVRDLANYDSVMVMPDGGWSDGVTLDANLVLYVDGGGGMVTTSFVPQQNMINVIDYSPINISMSPYGFGQSALGASNTGSPLLRRVSSFRQSDFWDGAATAKPGAHVGGYDTVHGAPLMAAWVPSRAGTVVTLNLYPPSGALRADFWDPASDGAAVLANGMLVAANGMTPRLSLTAGGLCPGSVPLDVRFATPNGTVAMASGGAGSFTLPGGPCAGTVIPLGQPVMRGFFQATNNGSISLAPNLVQGCGVRLVAMDLATCEWSVAVVP